MININSFYLKFLHKLILVNFKIYSFRKIRWFICYLWYKKILDKNYGIEKKLVMGFIGVIVLAIVGVLLLALMILTLIYLIVSYILQSFSVKKLLTCSGKKFVFVLGFLFIINIY